MARMFLDFECASTADIRETGAVAYVEHPSTVITLLAYALDDGEVVTVVHPTAADLPACAFAESTIFVAHNAGFDSLVWDRLADPLVEQRWECTRAMCRYFSIPADLESASAFFGQEQKIKLTPRQKSIFFRDPEAVRTHPEAQQFINYAAQDVRAMRSAYQQMRPKYPESEQRYFRDVLRINSVGVRLDLPAVKAAVGMRDHLQILAADQFRQRTGVRPSQRAKVQAWIEQACGLGLGSMAKGVLLRADFPPHVRNTMHLYSDCTLTSLAKLDAMLLQVSPDGRLRGQLNYYGAHTGRLSSSGVQLQNVPQLQHQATLDVFEALDEPTIGRRAAKLYSKHVRPLKALSTALRGFVISQTELHVVDYAQIEVRVLAWAAGETRLLEAFAAGRDVYKDFAVNLYSVPLEQVTPMMRKVAKAVVLGAGYGMGPLRFQQHSLDQGLVLTASESEMSIAGYREVNARTVAYWHAAEKAFRLAMAGQAAKAGPVTYKPVGAHVVADLPSGRRMYYRNAQLTGDEIWYQQPLGKQFVGKKIYGGLLVENAVQAMARDIMAHGMHVALQQGFCVVLTVHDEVVVDAALGRDDLPALERAMLTTERWAADIPLAVASGKDRRYLK